MEFPTPLVGREISSQKKKTDLGRYPWKTTGGGVKPLGDIKLIEMNSWLVVEPTPLKNMLVKMGSSSPIFGVEMKKTLLIW